MVCRERRRRRSGCAGGEGAGGAAREAAFDRAYIEREIAYHEAVLDALDKVLIPTTENDELKRLLVDVRPAFAAHLAYARQVGEKIHASR